MIIQRTLLTSVYKNLKSGFSLVKVKWGKGNYKMFKNLDKAKFRKFNRDFNYSNYFGFLDHCWQ